MSSYYHEDIFQYLQQFVKGQDKALRKLSILGQIYFMKSLTVHEHNKNPLLPLVPTPKVSVMLVGPTGTGKTLMTSKLAEYMNCPFVRIDCSTLTVTGWEGMDISDALETYAKQISPYFPMGVVLLDELDKLGSPAHGSHGGDHHRNIQANLLSLLEGKFRLTNRTGVNNTELNKLLNHSLILCAGAFADTYKHEKSPKKNIGFNTPLEEIPLIKLKDMMVKGGIMPELVGRIVDILETEPLSEDSIRNIILHSGISPYSVYHNMEPGFLLTNFEVDEMVKEIKDSEFGVRELETLMFNKFCKFIEAAPKTSIESPSQCEDTDKDVEQILIEYAQGNNGEENK